MKKMIKSLMKVGDKVQAEWEGSWYPAVILKSEPGRFFLHWDGYGDDWDGWVEQVRIREAAASPTGLAILKDGSSWAELEADGTLRIEGSISGEFVPAEGTVYKDGGIIGSVEPDGTIRLGSSLSGQIEEDGTLRRDGSIIGSISKDGTIHKDGSIWGEVESGCADFAAMRAVTAMLVFFAPDFGWSPE